MTVNQQIQVFLDPFLLMLQNALDLGHYVFECVICLNKIGRCTQSQGALNVSASLKIGEHYYRYIFRSRIFFIFFYLINKFIMFARLDSARLASSFLNWKGKPKCRPFF